MTQHRFKDGKAVFFCAMCLDRYGYPSPSSFARGIGATQAVTVWKGNALCEGHLNVVMLDV